MPEPIVKPSTLFVGRELELSQLHQTLQTVVNSKKPKFVLVQGDYGVGKTVLVEHFLTEASLQNSHILIGLGKCSMEKEFSGLVPFGQLFTSLTNQGIKRLIVLGGLLKFAKEVAPAWLDIVTAGVAGATVKTVEEGRKLLGNNTFSQENVFAQFTNALSRLAEKHPVIAFIDDLHWADTSSLGLLFHLARNLQDQAVLFIITYRPVEAMESSVNAALFRDIRANLFRYDAIELEIKQGIDVAQYVAQRYPLNAFPSTLIKNVQELTGGHALFVSQVFSLWEDKRTIAAIPTSGGMSEWRIVDKADMNFVIPQTLSEVLAERIRSMSDELREILVCASVEGEDFTVQTISRLCQLNELKASDSLELLDHHYYLIREDGTKLFGPNVFDFYRFAHRFFREHIYNQLTPIKKRVLHKQVAECLEALYSDHREIAGQLARHFREAYDFMKSAQYALMAAQFEQSRFTWEEGEKWCKFGLELVEKLPVGVETKQLRLDLLEQSGNGYFFWGKNKDAFDLHSAALLLAKQIAVSNEIVASMCCKLSVICDWRGMYSEAMVFVQEGLQVLQKDGTPITETYFNLESMHAWMEARMDNNGLAVELSRQILRDIETLPSTPQLDEILALNYKTLSCALGSLNQFKESLFFAHKMTEIAEKMNEKNKAINILVAAWRYFYAGKPDESMTLATKGLEIALKIGDLDEVALARSFIGSGLIIRGKFQEAIAELTEAIAISEQIGSFYDTPAMYAYLAIAHLGLFDLETAYQHASHSVRCAQETSIPSNLGEALDALARAEAAKQDWISSAQHFSQAVTHFDRAGDRFRAARSQCHFAEMMIAQGSGQEAINLLKVAIEVFRELDLVNEVKNTQGLINTAEAV